MCAWGFFFCFFLFRWNFKANLTCSSGIFTEYSVLVGLMVVTVVILVIFDLSIIDSVVLVVVVWWWWCWWWVMWLGGNYVDEHLW